MARHGVAKVSEIAPGTTRRVVVDSAEILLCNVDGKIYAIEDVCTHDGGPLDQGELEGEHVVCPRHGATFDVRTGDALTLPAVVPLMTFDVNVEGDEIYVDVAHVVKTLGRLALAALVLIGLIVLGFVRQRRPRHARARPRKRHRSRACGCEPRYRFCATIAACRTSSQVTSTTSSSRKVTSRDPTGCFRWTLLRRFMLGELAEVYGPRALSRPTRRSARSPCARSCEAQWAAASTMRSREILGAFSDGVNAAMEREPLPVEFRLLGYRPAPWTPHDSLAVAMVTVLDLIDDWDAIAPRDAAYRRGGLGAARRALSVHRSVLRRAGACRTRAHRARTALPAPRRDAGARARRRAPADRQQRVGCRREPHRAAPRAAR